MLRRESGVKSNQRLRAAKFMIKQHPEWDIVVEWFEKRANGNYGHTEVVHIESCISPEMQDAANDMARRAGESIRDLVLSFNG